MRNNYIYCHYIMNHECMRACWNSTYVVDFMIVQTSLVYCEFTLNLENVVPLDIGSDVNIVVG